MTKKILSSSHSETSAAVVSIESKCSSCDLIFQNEEAFKDHILTTIHKGPPSEGTRNFKYRMTSKAARTNLLKGARREHFSIEHKQGASNVDFSDGTWLLVAYQTVLKWKNKEFINANQMDIDKPKVVRRSQSQKSKKAIT